MSTKYWRWSIVCVAMARVVLNQAGAAPVTIGIPLPHGQVQGAEMTESMRQSLISQLKAQSIDAVPLSAPTGGLDAEVQAKHCSYVLYTRVENKHSTGSGVFGKLSLLTHGISPDALGARGGRVSNAAIRWCSTTASWQWGQAIPSKRIAERQSRFRRTRRRESSGRAVDQRGGCGSAGQGARHGTGPTPTQSSTQAASAASNDIQPSSNGSKIRRIVRAQKHFECKGHGRKHERQHGLRETREHAECAHVA